MWKPSTCPTDTSRLTVECGVPLPLSKTVADTSFPMGTCGTRTSLDPRVFGPDAWQMLHLFAQNYPTDPQPQVVEACERMINALPYMLPCDVCGYAFGQVGGVLKRGRGATKEEKKGVWWSF